MSNYRWVLAIAVALTVAACDDEAYRSGMQDAPPVDVLPPAEPLTPPPAPADAALPPPSDYSALPPPPQSSEETVQPESETLFY